MRRRSKATTRRSTRDASSTMNGRSGVGRGGRRGAADDSRDPRPARRGAVGARWDAYGERPLRGGGVARHLRRSRPRPRGSSGELGPLLLITAEGEGSSRSPALSSSLGDTLGGPSHETRALPDDSRAFRIQHEWVKGCRSRRLVIVLMDSSFVAAWPGHLAARSGWRGTCGRRPAGSRASRPPGLGLDDVIDLESLCRGSWHTATGRQTRPAGGPAIDAAASHSRRRSGSRGASFSRLGGHTVNS